MEMELYLAPASLANYNRAGGASLVYSEQPSREQQRLRPG